MVIPHWQIRHLALLTQVWGEFLGTPRKGGGEAGGSCPARGALSPDQSLQLPDKNERPPRQCLQSEALSKQEQFIWSCCSLYVLMVVRTAAKLSLGAGRRFGRAACVLCHCNQITSARNYKC